MADIPTAPSGPLYPGSIERLPDELLADIFEAHDIDDLAFSFTVSWVCSRWRGVALHIPSMWTSIRVTNPARHRHPLQARLADRWGAIPLRLQVELDDGRGVWNTGYFANMIATLAPLMPRAADLHLDTAKVQHTEIMSLSALPPAPALTHLTLLGSLPSVNYLLSFLALCPNLRDLSLVEVSFGIAEEGSDPIPVELPELHALLLQDTDLPRSNILMLFDCAVTVFLRTPNLHVLRIHSKSSLPDDELDDLYSIVRIADIRCTFPITGMNLVAVLRRLHAVEKLSLTFVMLGSSRPPAPVKMIACLPSISHIVLHHPLFPSHEESVNMSVFAINLVRATTDTAREHTLQGIHLSEDARVKQSAKDWIRKRVPDWPVSEQGELASFRLLDGY